ncbi:MAG: hypothetical protein GF383_05385 [Candidatus Lokiarchaeota archaeon]|nr:hypothetical protein [Candidatus Lokiarchaeota archaeon]MBD3339329.1 hypothetical protein [Candidatus Lokiarchaeota archaeon]
MNAKRIIIISLLFILSIQFLVFIIPLNFERKSPSQNQENENAEYDLYPEFDKNRSLTTAAGSWEPRTTLQGPWGSNPLQGAVGDVNNDGQKDIVIANLEDDTISIFTWNPISDTWNTETRIDVGDAPYSVDIGDVNNDGQNDIVTANYADQTISIILWNTTTETFANEFTKATSFSANFVCIGDANNDGEEDIVVSTQSKIINLFLWNISTNDWNARTSITAEDPGGPYIRESSVVDANNDGYNDLVSINSLSGNINLMIWDPIDEDWEDSNNMNMGAYPYYFDIDDINNDGYNDILVGDDDAKINYRYWNYTLKNWGPINTINIGGDGIKDVDIGDANNDGYNDIVAANYDGNFWDYLHIFLWNTSTNNWNEEIKKVVGGNPRDPHIDDVNNDGENDIITIDSSSSQASIFFWSTSTNDWAKQDVKSVSTTPSGMSMGDVNNDGEEDIVTVNFKENSVSILCWNSTTSDWNLPINESVGNGPQSIYIGDANNDGQNDIVTANNLDNNVSILCWNISLGTWDSPINKSVGFSPNGVSIGDANNDGTNDIVTANYLSDNVTILCWNSKTDNWNLPINETVGNGPYSVSIGDANNDGQNDIVTANKEDNNISILLWNASQGVWDTSIEKKVEQDPVSVALGDVNNDGEIDIVTANNQSNSVSILCWNTTTNNWNMVINETVNTNPVHVALGDANNDGQNDIVTANFYGNNVSILCWNISLGTWDSLINRKVGNRPISVNIGDANHDGQKDIVTANQLDGTISILSWTDTINPSWDESPTNQIINFGSNVSYNVNASDLSGISRYCLNNTEKFTIDEDGLITNKTSLAIGIYWLQITAYDPYNNNISAIINMTVLDISAPTWDEIPKNQLLESGAEFIYDINASDNSGISFYWINDTINFSIAVNGSISNESALEVGVYWLEIRACDPYNNNVTKIINITIEPSTPPEWDETIKDQFLEYGSNFFYDVNATDLSGIDFYWINDTINFTVDTDGVITNKSVLFIGVYWLEIRACDNYNNNATAIINVTVQDTTPPEWVEPIDTSQNLEFGSNYFYDVNATDPSGISDYWVEDDTKFTVDEDGKITNISSLSLGINSLMIGVNDTYNNLDIVNVQILVSDNTPPDWIESPEDRELELGTDFTYDVNATDPSGINFYWINDTIDFTVDADGLITNNSVLYIGVYWLEIRACDNYNNNATVIINVTVQDTTPPEWVEILEDREVEYGANFFYDVNATDPSGIDCYWINNTVNFIIDGDGKITNNSALYIGVYWLEIRACDNYNNNATAIINVTVQDTTPPEWLEPLEDREVEYGANFYYDVNATDPSGISEYWVGDQTRFYVDSDGIITNISSLSEGIHFLSISVNDTYNNIKTIVIRVTVTDTTPPNWIQNPQDRHSEFGTDFYYDVNATDPLGINFYWINNTVNFSIDGDGKITNNSALFIGVYWLEIRACDNSNNNATAIINITIQDTTPPDWNQDPTDQIFEFGTNFCYDLNSSDLSGIDYFWINDTVNFTIDANGVITNKTALDIGVYWLEIRACDLFNNNVTAIILILIEASAAPTLNQPLTNPTIEIGTSFSYVFNVSDLSGIDKYWINDTNNFQIDNDGVISNIVPLVVGVYWLEINANDTLGNILTLMINITVQSKASTFLGGDDDDDKGEKEEEFGMEIIIVILAIGSVATLSSYGIYRYRTKKIQSKSKSSGQKELRSKKLLTHDFSESKKIEKKPLKQPIEAKGKKLKEMDEAKSVPLSLTKQEKRELEKTEAEVDVKKDIIKCLVHRGPIKGSVYLCPNCQAHYCNRCAKVLKMKEETCWSCGSEIEVSYTSKEKRELLEENAKDIYGALLLENPEIAEYLNTDKSVKEFPELKKYFLNVITDEELDRIDLLNLSIEDKKKFLDEILNLDIEERRELIDEMLALEK